MISCSQKGRIWLVCQLKYLACSVLETSWWTSLVKTWFSSLGQSKTIFLHYSKTGALIGYCLRLTKLPHKFLVVNKWKLSGLAIYHHVHVLRTAVGLTGLLLLHLTLLSCTHPRPPFLHLPLWWMEWAFTGPHVPLQPFHFPFFLSINMSVLSSSHSGLQW